MTTVISFENTYGWLEAIWCKIECRADNIIAELDNLERFENASNSEREGCERPDCPEFDEVCLSIKDLAGKFDLCAFHATRAIIPDSFIEAGLRILNVDTLNFLNEAILSELNMEDGCCFTGLNLRSFEIPHTRAGRVCLSLKKFEPSSNEVKELYCSFGGEILDTFLEGKDAGLASRIRSLGKPMSVECHIPINSINNLTVNEIVKDMIKHTLNVSRNQSYDLVLPNLVFQHDIRPEYIHQVCLVSVEC